MNSHFAPYRMRLWIIAIAGLLLVVIAYFTFVRLTKPVAPASLTVSGCSDIKPGMKRIGEQLDFQFNAPFFRFDVPVTDLTIREGGPTDTGVRGVELKPKSSASPSYLSISWGAEVGRVGTVPEDSILAFSGPVVKRPIIDAKGQRIGEDTWGYRDNGERWRRVRLIGWLVARYGSINAKDELSYGSVQRNDAALFDRVISSVCIAPR